MAKYITAITKTNPFNTLHPDYTDCWEDWERWRLTYEGGKNFIQKYLTKFSDRESDNELIARKLIAYVPRFAAAAVDDIKNSIFQRVADVKRLKGPNSYQEAVRGDFYGVDLNGSSMGTFIGTEILPELLVMKRVGVVIDNFDDLGETLADKQGKRPYLGVYTTEDILSWSPRRPKNGYDAVLLREIEYTKDDFGLPNGYVQKFRLYKKTNQGVLVTFFDEKGTKERSVLLKIDRIPFVCFEINRSLLQDIAEYQISLMNLESSDIAFARKANYPFYYEFYDPKFDPLFSKGPGIDTGLGTATEAKTSGPKEKATGSSQGRRFPKDVEKPGFISPDPDTLRVSMEKGQQLKEDIRLIVNLNLQNINPRRQSAESQGEDKKGLEASLSFIGLVLQNGEQQIAQIWNMFEQSEEDPQVHYPKVYSLKSESDRRKEAQELIDIGEKIPSKTYKKHNLIKIARLTIADDVSDEEFTKIQKEIFETKSMTSDPRIIIESQAAGLIQKVTASDALGFDGEAEIPKANEEHAEMLARVINAQGEASSARGANEFGGKNSSEEKQGKQKRGEANL